LIVSSYKDHTQSASLFSFLILRPHPSSTLFPYTTLFRSLPDRYGPFKVRQREGRLAVTAVKRTQEREERCVLRDRQELSIAGGPDRKSTRLNSSHVAISYAVFCLKKKKRINTK